MLFFCSMTVAVAQSSMTDEQVIRFIMKEQQNGSTQQEIVARLVQKGVTVEQLRRVQKKAERLKNNQGLGTDANRTLGTDDNGRLRNTDAYQRRDPNSTTAKLKDEKLSQRQGSKRNRRENQLLENQEEALGMRETLDEFMPDSLDIYDRQVIRNYLKAKAEYEK